MTAREQTLLIVEDEEEIRKGLIDCLQDLGYTLDSAENGAVGLEKVKKNQAIIAVLSDVNMPELSGLEMIRKMREVFCYTPVLFLSGFSNKEMILEARRQDAFSVVDKPYEEKILRQRVGLLLSLGETIRLLDKDIERLIEAQKVPPEQVEEFKRTQKKQKSAEIVQKFRGKLMFGSIK
jgi:CheY-like chemotaxis protein